MLISVVSGVCDGECVTMTISDSRYCDDFCLLCDYRREREAGDVGINGRRKPELLNVWEAWGNAVGLVK